MPRVLITGAGRGIGLEFARQYADDGWQVIGTVRDEAAAQRLQGFGAAAELVDMRDFAALAALAERLTGPFDLLIANAGLSGPGRINSASAAEQWQAVHAVNSVAPVLLAELLLPRMAQAQGKMVAVSSLMGSIADSSGGWLSYRASKAALNAAWHSLALSLGDQPVILALLHPGWVRTDMGGSGAPLAAADSVAGMRRVIAGLERRHSGGFFDHQGKPLPW